MNIQIIEGLELKGALNGWIDLKGQFYQLHGFAQHNDFAVSILCSETGDKDLLNNLKYLDSLYEKHNCSYAYELLVQRGWVRMINWGLPSEKHSVLLDIKPENHSINSLNSFQKNTLEEWLLWNQGFEFKFL